MNNQDETWSIYVPMEGVVAYRRISEPDESEPMVVVRMGEHTVNDLLHKRAAGMTIGDAVMKFKELLVQWAGDGLDEARYYCVGVMAEVTLAGELNAVEVAFRRQVEGAREVMN